MTYTPSTVIKTRVERRRAYFTRYACKAFVYLPDRYLDECLFTGMDGRKVRAAAIQWAHHQAELRAKQLCTAWRDVRDSSKNHWG